MNEYLYILGRSGLPLKYKTYSIVTQEYELEEWENNTLEKEFGN